MTPEEQRKRVAEIRAEVEEIKARNNPTVGEKKPVEWYLARVKTPKKNAKKSTKKAKG